MLHQDSYQVQTTVQQGRLSSLVGLCPLKRNCYQRQRYKLFCMNFTGIHFQLETWASMPLLSFILESTSCERKKLLHIVLITLPISSRYTTQALSSLTFWPISSDTSVVKFCASCWLFRTFFFVTYMNKVKEHVIATHVFCINLPQLSCDPVGSILSDSGRSWTHLAKWEHRSAWEFHFSPVLKLDAGRSNTFVSF